MTETTPANWLASAAKSRAWSGRSRIGLAIAYAVGAAPSILFVGLMRSPGYGDLPIIAALFLLGPAVTSAVWCHLDRASTDARELLMWLAAVNKTRSRQRMADAANSKLDKTLHQASEMASRGAAPSQVLELVRSAIEGNFARTQRMSVFVTQARFGPVVWWAILSVTLLAAFGLMLLATPSCEPGGPPAMTICH